PGPRPHGGAAPRGGEPVSTAPDDTFQADSARTWRDGAARPDAVPAELRPPPPGSVPVRERHRRLWARHALRRARARAYVDSSMHPEHGLPVASSRTVVDYLGGLLRRRAVLVVVVVVANALAAGA